MTLDDFEAHVGAVVEKLPETAISARLALSLIAGEYERLTAEVEQLRLELTKAPRLTLVRNEESKRAFDGASPNDFPVTR